MDPSRVARKLYESRLYPFCKQGRINFETIMQALIRFAVDCVEDEGLERWNLRVLLETRKAGLSRK